MVDPDEPSDRSALRTRVLDQAAALLRERGLNAVTTRGVADAANTQAPTIYRLFGDKDGLLEAVAEHVMAQYVDAKVVTVSDATSSNIDPVQDMRAGWRAHIEFGLQNPELFTMMSDPARGRHSAALQAGAEPLAQRVHRLAEKGWLRVSEQHAVELIRAAGTGAVLTTLSLSEQSRDASLADALLGAVLDTILVDHREDSDDEVTRSAIALRAATPELSALTTAERGVMTEWLDRIVQDRTGS